MSRRLFDISHGEHAEFDLDLIEAGSLHCSQVVRRVPGKRIVCRGSWEGQPVYAKVFIGAGAVRYMQRDLAGVRLLQAAAIQTPDLLFSGVSADGIPLLVFAEIAGSTSADVALESAQEAERKSLALRLVQAVAAHHAAGLRHADLYPKNFLVQGERLYTIDGDAVRRLPGLGRRQAALKNLAVLVSKLEVLDAERWMPDIVRTYTAARPGIDIDVDWLRSASARHRTKVASDYADRKVFRQCSDVAVTQDGGMFLAINRTFDEALIRQHMQTPDDLLEAKQIARLKNGNTCTVGLAELAGVRIVLKRYNIKHFWHAIDRAWRPSRAARSWANAFRLQILQVPTPRPVMLLERRWHGLRRQAYFAAEYAEAPDVAQFFATTMDETRRREAAEKIAELFYRLYLLKISHGDCKATNIKLAEGQPLLIDLDSMLQHCCAWWFRNRHARDLRRFMQNWQDQPEVAAMLRRALLALHPDKRVLASAGLVD